MLIQTQMMRLSQSLTLSLSIDYNILLKVEAGDDVDSLEEEELEEDDR